MPSLKYAVKRIVIPHLQGPRKRFGCKILKREIVCDTFYYIKQPHV